MFKYLNISLKLIKCWYSKMYIFENQLLKFFKLAIMILCIENGLFHYFDEIQLKHMI